MKHEIIKRNQAPANKKRRFCIFLAFMMIFGMVIPVLPVAAAAGETDAEKQSRLAEARELFNAVSYQEYLKAESGLYFDEHGVMPMGSGEIVIKPEDVISGLTTAVGVKTSDEMGKKALYLPEDGSVSFKFTIAKEGLYNLSFTYLQVVGKRSAIERTVRIDNKVPFKEARYITFTKTYVDKYEDFDEATGEPLFKKDIKDNEIRPPKEESPEWRTVLTEDSSGFVKEPFLYYLTAGEHILTLEAVRESVYINELKFFVSPEIPTYDEYKASYPDKKGAADIPKIQAEKPTATSEIVIYPLNDRTSAITEPQDASRIRLNSIGSNKWQLYGQWIRYEFEVPAGGDGWYYIAPRFKQDVYSGVYSSRKIRLDGAIPFKEAGELRFNFSDNWQVEPLNDGTIINPEAKKSNREKKLFEFYLTEGKHVIEFEVALGDMAELLGNVDRSLKNLNEIYRKIRMITGATPDAYRDYGFERQIPEVLIGMDTECNNLRDTSAQLEAIIGAKGEHTVLLEKIALQLDRMCHNTDRIAPGMDQFKSNIGGLATWLLERRNQPLEIDYIKIQKIGEKMPKAEANFFEAAAFEFKAFIMSFFSDYNSQGMMAEITDKTKVVEAWMGSSSASVGGLALSGRDQAQVARQMVVDFTNQTNIQVNLKLVAGGSLLPSVLAGVGPDLALSNGGGDAVNLAIRSAVLPLNYYKDKETGEYFPTEYTKGDASKGISSFDEVRTWFTESAFKSLTLHDSRIADPSKYQVFAVPETQTFSMMFYRKDIFVDLNIEVPRTWNDLYNIVPILQKKNLEVGIGPGAGPLFLFMFQENVPFYIGDGIESNMNDNRALDAYKRMTYLYTIYKFPVEFDFANRFRSGEMPISIQGYDAYNQLMVFAPEIRGLWEFVPLPGTIREKTPADEGKGFAELENGMIIDNTSSAGVNCTLMMRTSAEKGNTENAWAFMQWWVGAEAQGRFGSELVAMMGAAAKYPTANLEALDNMPWPTADYKNLQEQFKHLQTNPEVPGSYISGRYLDWAWRDAYNNGANVVERLQDDIIEINKELTRKRTEFGMPVIERDRLGRRLDRDIDIGD